MTAYEKSLKVLEELFGKDCTFVLATAQNNIPSTRVVDTFYDNGEFWIVTYSNTHKVIEMDQNPNISLCNSFQILNGKAYNAGHPLLEENKTIREKLIKVFEPWYFAHNNENDENMCYVRVKPDSGFFHKDGTGYKVNFIKKTAEEFSFAPQL